MHIGKYPFWFCRHFIAHRLCIWFSNVGHHCQIVLHGWTFPWNHLLLIPSLLKWIICHVLKPSDGNMLKSEWSSLVCVDVPIRSVTKIEFLECDPGGRGENNHFTKDHRPKVKCIFVSCVLHNFKSCQQNMASVPLPQHICLVSDLCVMFYGDRFNGGPTNRVRNLSVEARDLRCDGCSETWFRFVIHVDNLRILSQPTIRPKSKSEMQYSYIAG